MACTSETQSAPLRFTIPPSLQGFHAFVKFPYDIRHMIWESIILTPGIHFLKFVEALDTSASGTRAAPDPSSGHSSSIHVERRNEGTRDARHPLYSALLKPHFPRLCADNSHYTTMGGILANLRNSCQEARYVVDRALAHPDNLALDNGRLVTLHQSADIVCIDFPGLVHGRSLGKWRERLDPTQLAKVRRLAIRYQHEWDDARMCSYCGQSHSRHQKQHPHPRHVYEFAALFKNLEEFYFLDYLTVTNKSSHMPCHSNQQTQDTKSKGKRFASGQSGRSYFEVDPSTCTTYTRAHDTLSWVQRNYIRHCRRKSLGPLNPEKVGFKILGCEWDADQQSALVKKPEPQATQTRPKRKKRAGVRNRARRNTAPSQRSSTLDPTSQSHQLIECNTLPVVFGDNGKSKFDFSLEISL
ncbi:hypothetical protein GGS20DRAFT_520025 [Poronia punctata]|nr:hypothetical protein GGS20DRAFT_520025 [Poronia punctata]